MPTLLEKIRNWPPEKKKKAMIWTTALIMVAVIAIWLVFFNNFSSRGSSDGTIWQNAIQKFKDIIGSYKAK